MIDVTVENFEAEVVAASMNVPVLVDFAHHARTVCRRAERALVALALEEAVNDAPRQYLNRLSDLLFVLGRVLNRAGGRGDVLWQKRKNA